MQYCLPGWAKRSDYGVGSVTSTANAVPARARRGLSFVSGESAMETANANESANGSESEILSDAGGWSETMYGGGWVTVSESTNGSGSADGHGAPSHR